jgi:hypothetical protein
VLFLLKSFLRLSLLQEWLNVAWIDPRFWHLKSLGDQIRWIVYIEWLRKYVSTEIFLLADMLYYNILTD